LRGAEGGFFVVLLRVQVVAMALAVAFRGGGGGGGESGGGGALQVLEWVGVGRGSRGGCTRRGIDREEGEEHVRAFPSGGEKSFERKESWLDP